MNEIIRMMIKAHEETERDWIDLKTLSLFYEMANNQTIAVPELMKRVLNSPEIEKSGDKVRLQNWKNWRKKLTKKTNKKEKKTMNKETTPAVIDDTEWETFTSKAMPSAYDKDLLRISITNRGHVYLRVWPDFLQVDKHYLIQARAGAVRFKETDSLGFKPQRYRNGNKLFFRLAGRTAKRFIEVLKVPKNKYEIYFKHMGNNVFEEVKQ